MPAGARSAPLLEGVGHRRRLMRTDAARLWGEACSLICKELPEKDYETWILELNPTVFEETDGWVVVDWKTDRISTTASCAEREALYAPQLASYARALIAVLGPGTNVKETILAFARG